MRVRAYIMGRQHDSWCSILCLLQKTLFYLRADHVASIRKSHTSFPYYPSWRFEVMMLPVFVTDRSHTICLLFVRFSFLTDHVFPTEFLAI